jgi:hypothetical protein
VSATMAQRNKMMSQPAGIEEKEMDSFLNDCNHSVPHSSPQLHPSIQLLIVEHATCTVNAAGDSSRASCCCCISFVLVSGTFFVKWRERERERERERSSS